MRPLWEVLAYLSVITLLVFTGLHACSIPQNRARRADSQATVECLCTPAINGIQCQIDNYYFNPDNLLYVGGYPNHFADSPREMTVLEFHRSTQHTSIAVRVSVDRVIAELNDARERCLNE